MILFYIIKKKSDNPTHPRPIKIKVYFNFLILKIILYYIIFIIIIFLLFSK